MYVSRPAPELFPARIGNDALADAGSIEVFDAVVIGGGPAGSAAAFTLASGGASVCLIDKSDFPRDKLCGGGVTGRGRSVFESVFGRSWDGRLFLPSADIEFRSNGRLIGGATDQTGVFLTMRRDFDEYLLGLARAAGATLMLKTRIARVDLAHGALTPGDGAEIRFRHLVGADGVNSMVAKALCGAAFLPATIGFGLEVEVPRDHLPEQGDRLEIDFSAASWGYGWVFPKHRTHTIGVAGIHARNPDMKARLADYLALKNLDAANYRVKGQYIPFGDYRRRPGRDNVLLAGDAAGFADPITGEGIAFAMQSGAAAGRAILDSLASPGVVPADRYFSEISGLTRGFRDARFWRWLIYPAPVHGLFTRAFSRAGVLQRGYLDILAGRREYDALPGLFARQAGRALKRLARL